VVHVRVVYDRASTVSRAVHPIALPESRSRGESALSSTQGGFPSDGAPRLPPGTFVQ
jgi:hypothetical protein